MSDGVSTHPILDIEALRTVRQSPLEECVTDREVRIVASSALWNVTQHDGRSPVGKTLREVFPLIDDETWAGFAAEHRDVLTNGVHVRRIVPMELSGYSVSLPTVYYIAPLVDGERIVGMRIVTLRLDERAVEQINDCLYTIDG